MTAPSIGKIYHHEDPRLNQELARIYDYLQNGLLGRNQVDTESLAEVVGRTLGQSIPDKTIDGRAIKTNSILGNRLVDGIIGANQLDNATATRIHDNAVFTVGAEAANVIELNAQVDTVKTGLSAVSSLVVFWGSISNNKNSSPPTTGFTSLSVTTGTLLANLGAIAGTPELCLLCSTTTAGRLIVDVEVVGASTLFFYLSSGTFIAESGAVSWS